MFSNIYFKSNLYIYTGKVGKANWGGGGVYSGEAYIRVGAYIREKALQFFGSVGSVHLRGSI